MVTIILAGLLLMQQPLDQNGGGVGVPPGAAPYAKFPTAMSGGLDSYPTQVSAGSVFHVKGHATDTDTWVTISKTLVQCDSAAHVFEASQILSGTVKDQSLTATRAGGERDYDITIQAIADTGGLDFIFVRDYYIAHDNWWNDTWLPHDALTDPDVGPFSYYLKITK